MSEVMSVEIGPIGKTVPPLPPELEPVVERLRKALADRSEYDVAALARKLEQEHGRGNIAAIIEWLQVSVSYQPYAGCLRGAQGALWERSANALDACLLLAEILDHHGLEVELELGRIDENHAREKVEAFLTGSVPGEPEPVPDRSGYQPEELRCLQALMNRAELTCDRARSALWQSYQSMILLMQADIADGGDEAAEMRFLQWASEARELLRIDVDSIISKDKELPGPFAQAFRSVLDEAQEHINLHFAPWLERLESRQRRQEPEPIADVLRWAASGFSCLTRTLMDLWTVSLQSDVLEEIGAGDKIAYDLAALRLLDTRHELERQTSVVEKALNQALRQAGIDPLPAEKNPIEAAVVRARQHAVVRFRADANQPWRCLDPDKPQPEDTAPWGEPEWSGSASKLPEEKYHRITFSVRVERRKREQDGYVLVDEIPLKQQFKAVDLAGTPVRFTILPWQPGMASAFGKSLFAKVSGAEVVNYVPTLLVGHRWYAGNPVSIAREADGAASALGGNFADVIGEVTGIWLEAVLQGPEGTRVLPGREWLDRWGIENRTEPAAEEGAPWWLRRPADISVEPKPLSQQDKVAAFVLRWAVIGVYSGLRSPSYIFREGLGGLFREYVDEAADNAPPGLVEVLSKNYLTARLRTLLEDEQTIPLASDPGDVSRLETHLLSEVRKISVLAMQCEQMLYGQMSWEPAPGRCRLEPALISIEASIETDELTDRFDLWWDQAAHFSRGADGFSRSLAWAVRAALAEGAVSSLFVRLERRGSVAASFCRAVEQGINVVAVAGSTLDLTPFSSLSAQCRGRMRERSHEDSAIVAVVTAAQADNEREGFWWIDLGSGEAVTVSQTGRHSAKTEYYRGVNTARIYVQTAIKRGTPHTVICLTLWRVFQTLRQDPLSAFVNGIFHVFLETCMKS